MPACPAQASQHTSSSSQAVETAEPALTPAYPSVPAAPATAYPSVPVPAPVQAPNSDSASASDAHPTQGLANKQVHNASIAASYCCAGRRTCLYGCHPLFAASTEASCCLAAHTDDILSAVIYLPALSGIVSCDVLWIFHIMNHISAGLELLVCCVA